MLRTMAALSLVMGLNAESRLVEGNAQSPVRILVYEDLQCPDCAAFREMLDKSLLPKYASKVAVEHRDFPLPKHAWAKRAAVAARLFEQQKPETGVAFRRYAMAHLREITVANFDEKLREFAKGHGVDGAKAVAALDDAKLIALVEEDYQEGVARGVAKTPSVFVNGEPFIETFTLEAISKSIDAAIAENKL